MLRPIPPDLPAWRRRVLGFVESTPAERFIVALIVINAVTLGLETSATAMQVAGPLLLALDGAILAVFVVEILLRLLGRGLGFFRDPWSVFDLAVVAVALVPATATYSALRALRVLRVLRLVSMVPQMRRVVGALLGALPGLSSIVLVLLLVFYVFAVMATQLFGADFPEWFGTIGRSMYTLFQVMTLESWSMGIVRPVMAEFPAAWAFFLPFILATTFTMLNLFVAIIVSAMQSQTDASTERTVGAVVEATHEVDVHVHEELTQLRAEISELRRAIERLPARSHVAGDPQR
ncbi:MAG TPA: ion transporter [Steroidobacteraceae bacterium]|nr:ion transporter [Steroidobacteraceae bacterium]